MKAAVLLALALMLALLAWAWGTRDHLGPGASIDAAPMEVMPGSPAPDVVPGIDVSPEHPLGRSSGQAAPASPAAEAPSLESSSESSVAQPGAAEAPLEIPPGTVLIGRVVDASGDAVSYATLFVQVAAFGMLDRSLDLDASGRFAVRIHQPGKTSFYLESSPFGRSEDLTAELIENEATDIGTVQLAGGGRLGGRVQLADGTPLPGVRVTAKSISLAPTRGIREATCTSDADGGFVFGGLVSGTFAVTAQRKGTLPAIGVNTFQSGNMAALLTVDAHLVRISLPPVKGKVVPIRWVALSAVGDRGSRSRDFRGAEAKSLRAGTPYAERVLPVGGRVLIEGKGGEGKHFSSVLESEVPSGFYRVVLREDLAQLGRVRFTVPLSSDLKASELSVSGSRGERLILFQKDLSSDTDPIQYVELIELRPGPYDFSVRVNSPWTILGETRFHVDLTSGATEEVALELIRCGRIDLAVAFESGGSADVPERARVHIRGPGESEWRTVSWSTQRRSAGHIWLDGALAQSRLLAPGRYRLRLSADGCATVEVDVDVLEAEATRLDLSLLRDP